MEEESGDGDDEEGGDVVEEEGRGVDEGAEEESDVKRVTSSSESPGGVSTKTI